MRSVSEANSELEGTMKFGAMTKNLMGYVDARHNVRRN